MFEQLIDSIYEWAIGLRYSKESLERSREIILEQLSKDSYIYKRLREQHANFVIGRLSGHASDNLFHYNLCKLVDENLVRQNKHTYYELTSSTLQIEKISLNPEHELVLRMITNSSKVTITHITRILDLKPVIVLEALVILEKKELIKHSIDTYKGIAVIFYRAK